MTVDEWPVGEYPDVTIAEVCRSWDDLVQENEDLRAENLLLRAQLTESRDELAIAKVLHNRRGW